MTRLRPTLGGALTALLLATPAAQATARPPSPLSATGLRPWAAAPPARPAAAAGLAAPATAVRSAGLRPCDEVPGGLCGHVSVPLDRDRPRRPPPAPQVAIFFAVFPRTDATAPAERPIFVTFGGPGVSATQAGGEGF